MKIVKIVVLVATSWALMCLAGYTAEVTAGTDMAWWGFPTFLFSIVFSVVAVGFVVHQFITLGEKK